VTSFFLIISVKLFIFFGGDGKGENGGKRGVFGKVGRWRMKMKIHTCQS
jgi:hypothetical protein